MFATRLLRHRAAGQKWLSINEIMPNLSPHAQSEVQTFLTSDKKNQSLTKSTKGEVAKEVNDWISEINRDPSGTHVDWTAHMWSPLRSGCGIKKDGLIDFDSQGRIRNALNPDILFHGQTDGSSHPTGGLRRTNMAGGYLSWDLSSPLVKIDDTIVIPTTFVSYHGESLDHKIGLLRSQEAVCKASSSIIKLLSNDDVTVHSNCGWEQEFFLIDLDVYKKRPDLVNTGRTLVGNLPPLHQQKNLHYMSKQKANIETLFTKFTAVANNMNTAVNVGHAEVAPKQHEFCPIFTIGSVSADQNLQMMHIFEHMAEEANFKVLYHEKPFEGVNGSGKHVNWSLTVEETGDNLISIGKSIEDQTRFMVFMSAIVRGMSSYNELMRFSVTSASNDHRLGAQEAPPAIISMSTGDYLLDHFKDVIGGAPLHICGTLPSKQFLSFEASTVSGFERVNEDRNRTSPFAYTDGNRFEFRAVGSSQNVSTALTFINTIVADSLVEIQKEIEKTDVDTAVRKFLKEHLNIIFNGDCYSEEWKIEAIQNRNLSNLKDTPSVCALAGGDKFTDVFVKNGIYSKKEALSRQTVSEEAYLIARTCEADTLYRMISTKFLPAVYDELARYPEKHPRAVALNGHADELFRYTQVFPKLLQKLDGAEGSSIHSTDMVDLNKALVDSRKEVDELELIMMNYPYPTYSDLLLD